MGRTRTSTFAPNLRVVSLLVAGDTEGAASLLERGDARSFAEFVDANKLEFHVAALPADSRVRRAIPADGLHRIDEYCASQRERQEMLVGELWSLADTLDAAGIEFIVLKGLYFAERFCGGLSNRFSWDLDVMVRGTDAARVDRILRRNGYFRRSAVLLARSITAHFTHAFDYGNERPRFSVDLHWLLSRHPSFAVDYEALWTEREPYDLLGRRFHVLSDEYEIVSNVLSTFRDIQRGAVRLRAFVDLYRVLEAADNRLDWAEFLARRRTERIAGVTVNVLSLLLDGFDCADRFPGAAGMVASARDLVVTPPAGDHAALFEPARGALANRAWTAAIYDCSRAEVAAWWLVSLPFRMAVYKSGRRYANFKRRIHVMRQRRRGRLPRRSHEIPSHLP